ncbi:hypothetical protein LUZ60_007199 [Juncus effusus]|nr:hypothetical protein LUZ60_007199 [Juncus effusus]
MTTPLPDDDSHSSSKLHTFLNWLQANGAELRNCTIKPCLPSRGFGVFSTSPSDHHNSIPMVVPLDLAITPMRVLQDSTLGPTCRDLFNKGGTDDRFLVMLFLLVESLRPDSLWKPYLDILPRKFGTPLWFSETELCELKGTTLYQATLLQRKSLQALYENKVRVLVEELLNAHGFQRTRELQYEDFLWANSIFWTRALNIPMPHSYVFPNSQEKENSNKDSNIDGESSIHATDHSDSDSECNCGDSHSESGTGDSVWVEGLVPAIDFCNHGLRAAATWEVDSAGSACGIPNSMYLIFADEKSMCGDKEINISYGNKGNEELLYLYGFVIENNTDDYLMVHYPIEALQNLPSSDEISKFLEIQNSEMRCLLPKSSLSHGFFAPKETDQNENNNNTENNMNNERSNYSWSGTRKVPSYINKLVFPEEFISTLRTVSMKEKEIHRVSSLLSDLVGEEREASESEVQSAIWEVCGDFGAFELLIDLLSSKLKELEEGSGTEESDTELLEKLNSESQSENEKSKKRNYYASLVYRRGQKQLAKLFLKEAQKALELCVREGS